MNEKALAFYASGLLRVVTAYFVFQIARQVQAGALPQNRPAGAS
jgi:hypothetical protein